MKYSFILKSNNLPSPQLILLLSDSHKFHQVLDLRKKHKNTNTNTNNTNTNSCRLPPPRPPRRTARSSSPSTRAAPTSPWEGCHQP